VHGDGIPKAALVDKALDCMGDGLEACPHGFHDEDSTVSGQFKQAAKLRTVGRRRLLN